MIPEKSHTVSGIQETNRARSYLQKLCVDIHNRRVGSPGNREATDFFAQTVSSFGFETQSVEFDCMDWRQEGVSLVANDIRFEAFASPYSLGCKVSAPLVIANIAEVLETEELAGKIVMLRGELASEQGSSFLPTSTPKWGRPGR